MAIEPGTRVGPYEVIALLGEGGMGQVWRAHHSALKRDVALKVLPGAFASDLDRLARFQREAQILASLNHPNIAIIHGLEVGDGVTALVMEFIEGPTLADRIAHGPLPIDDSLTIAKQIADALEAAHEKGIIHRDLKPANIKLRTDGTVKVLDFGLAKDVGTNDANSPGASQSPTVTSPAQTMRGVILGTAAYMSPEQARGMAVDKRADIWAFGVVMFEVLTGRPLFSGESITDVLAAIVTREPDFSPLPSATPPRVRDLLRRCLQKDPRKRLRDIGEARIAIDTILDGGDDLARDVARHREAARWRRALPWAIAAASVASAAGVWMLNRPGSGPAERWETFTQLTDLAGEEGAPTISPDGTLLAYTSRARGSSDIYIQRIGGRNAILVAGDPDRQESAPAFSPDGRRLAFHEEDADGGIFITGATGESSRRLTDTGFHPAWSPDGRSIAYCTEVFASRGPAGRMGISALWLADVESGQTRQIDRGDAMQPAWSPSGRRIAFWGFASPGASQRDLFTIAVAGGQKVAATHDAPLDWSPVWASDGRSLYFASNRGGPTNIWRIPLEETTGAPLGPPESVTGGVQSIADLPSLSKDGTKLVYRSRTTTVNPVAVPFDVDVERLGTPKPLLEQTGILSPKDVSSDGAWLLLGNFGERREDIFVARTDGSDLRRLTDDEPRDRAPRWSPDGQEVAFYSTRSGSDQIWTIRSDGSRLMQRSDVTGGGIMYPQWSPTDDRMMASMPRVGHMLGFVWPYGAGWASATELPGLRTSGGWLRALDWSPDGRRLAGAIQDAGANAVGIGWYDLRAGTTTIVSQEKLPTPSDVVWLPDSRRMLFVNDTGEIVIVDADSKRRNVLTQRWPFQIGEESVALAPDGRTLYLGARRVESDIWMVERHQQ